MEKTEQEGGALVGELPSMFRCAYWLVFAMMAVTVIALVAWCFVGRIGENVCGCGIITGHSLYGAINAIGDGVLVTLDVKPGDRVACGQVVGRLLSPSDRTALRRAHALMVHHRDIYEKNRDHVKALTELRQGYSTEELKRLEASLARQRVQLDWYKEFIKKFPEMAAGGVVSRYQAQDAQDRYDNRLLAIDTDEAAKLSEKFKARQDLFSLDHDLFDYEIVAEQTRVELDELLNLVQARSRIISFCAGEVANVNVDVGDVITVGQEIVRLIADSAPGAETWVTYAYFSAPDAKEIVPGMEALIIPSIVDVEEDGAIRGFVCDVDEAFETMESITHSFRSAAFARAVSASCRSVPIRVKLMMVRDDRSANGFVWTSGRGPDIQIPHGTFCSVTVRTRDHSPMSILLGRARRIAFGDGILEDDYIHNMRNNLSGGPQ